MRRIIAIVALSLMINANLVAQSFYSDYNSLMMMELMRAASDYDHRLTEMMIPVIKDLRAKYDNGRYQECIDEVNGVFDRITFYKRNYYIYSWLYYYRGISYLNLDEEQAGIANLVEAMNAHNEDAAQLLRNYFSQYLTEAINDEKHGYYRSCLQNINKAKATQLTNYALYETEGKALEGMYLFDDARKSYRMARKQGSPNVRELMKQLRAHKKHITKK